jgi:HEAT repeat protein
MFLIVVVVLVLVAVWWLRRERTVSFNERMYLKRRGYDPVGRMDEGPPVAKDQLLLSLIESLGDLSPFSRQRAAEELSRMCASGRCDPRMFSSLVSALDDRDASVRSAVATALGNLGDTRAVEPLTRRVEVEESIHVRASLQNAIRMLTDNTSF